ncbi:MAG: hypothetical protein ACFE9L_10465 [Candidatus Hodarchaeota archaeon]
MKIRKQRVTAKDYVKKITVENEKEKWLKIFAKYVSYPPYLGGGAGF